MKNRKILVRLCSLTLTIALIFGVVPVTFADGNSVISSIDFEDAKVYIGNVTGKTAVGDMNYTIIPANAGNPDNRAKVKVVKLADQENYYPGVNDSQMGEKALLFERSGSRSCMTRWTEVFNLSDTEVGEKYRVSVWVYTADVVEAGSDEGTSVVRFFVSKGGKYDSSDPSSKQHLLHKSVPNGVWTELAFEFEMTKKIKEAGANSFRMDSNGTEGSYAQTIFIDNFKIEKATNDGSVTGGQTGAGETGKTEETKGTEKKEETDILVPGIISDYDKIKGQSYENAVKVLHSLGIISGDDDGKFDPERKLTRAEMLSIILRMIEPIGASNSSKTEFGDVPSTHWAYESIAVGVDTGIVNGDGNGKFRPDDSVSGAEAIKMIVSAIGYDVMSEMEGGFPIGYIAVANNLKLLDKVSFDANAPILRWQCAQLVFNALEVNLLETKYTSNGTIDTITSGDKTVLGEYHDTKSIKGMLTAVPEASLEIGKEVQKGYIAIDGVIYKCNLKLEELLGKNCVFYIKDRSTDDWEVICAYETRANEETIEIPIEDIISMTAISENSVRIRYILGSKEDTCDFSGGNILYNKEEIAFSSKGDFQTFLDSNVEQGMIRIVENDTVNTLFIENYKAYVVSRVSNSNEKIFYIVYGKDKNTQDELDLSRIEYKIYDADGTSIELEDLETDDVISVYANNSADKLSIYRSKERISGKLENMEYLSGDGPYDWQPPVASIQYVKKADFNYCSWQEAASNTDSKTFADGTKKVIVMKRGGNVSAPAPYTTPTFTATKISYEDMLAVTSSSYQYGSDSVLDEIFYDESGKLKMGSGLKSEADASVQMVRYNNVFDTVTPGTAEQSARFKLRFAIYLTDIQDSQGNPDTDNSVTEIPVKVALRTAANEDVEYVDFNVPVNQWYILEPEWMLSGNVAGIHGIRLDLGNQSAGSKTAYTTPYAKTIYHGGSFEMWMDDEVMVSPETPPETCEYEATISGKKYYIADTMPDSLLFWSPLGIGSSATFLLDHNGRIAGYIHNNASLGDYGLLMKAAAETPGEPGMVRILTSNGQLKTFKCADKIRAFDGTQIVSKPISHFITNEPADSKDSWYIWSNNNSSNFCMTPKTWLYELQMSDAASRKLVYYKTNSEGLITQILVPSMPQGMSSSKLKMLRDFTNISATSTYDTLVYRKGYDYLVTSNQEVTPAEEKHSYKISDDILVYYVTPNDYREEDYRISSLDSLPDNSYLMQVYSFSDDETADAIVVCPQNKYPSMVTSVMVDHFGIGEDDTHILYGYNNGEEISCKIPDNLRISERLWYRDAGHTEKLTRDNILDAKEGGIRPYQSTYEENGEKTPYVYEANLQRGDVVAVEISKGKAVNVEVVSRIDDGIGLSRSLHNATDIGSMLDQAVTTKVGTVEEVSDDGEYVKLQSYAWTVPGFIVSGVLKNQASSQIQSLELWYHISDLPVTIRDTKQKKIYIGTIGDIEPGDEAIILGKVTKPVAIYVWKNTSDN